MKATIANLKKLVASHGGIVESDGCGGLDLLANRDATRKWTNTDTWCQPLPLGEIEPEFRQEEIRRAMDCVSGGTCPFND